ESYPRSFFDPVVKGRAAAPAAAVASEEAEPLAAGADVISLEDADAEATGKKTKAVIDPELDSEDDVDVETGDDEDDNTFLETDEEEEGGDVSDIIGDGIAKEDET